MSPKSTETCAVGKPARLLSIADPELVNLSDGRPSESGETGLNALKTRLWNLFQRFKVKLTVIVNEIRLQGNVGHDYRRFFLSLILASLYVICASQVLNLHSPRNA
jgi:hypothetical protein